MGGATSTSRDKLGNITWRVIRMESAMSRSLTAALAVTDAMSLAVWPLFVLPGRGCDLGSSDREGIV